MIAFINAAQIERDALFECEQREPALQLEIGERLRALEGERAGRQVSRSAAIVCHVAGQRRRQTAGILIDLIDDDARSEEHTSELQSLMRNSYAVLCLKKKKKH